MIIFSFLKWRDTTIVIHSNYHALLFTLRYYYVLVATSHGNPHPPAPSLTVAVKVYQQVDCTIINRIIMLFSRAPQYYYSNNLQMH